MPSSTTLSASIHGLSEAAAQVLLKTVGTRARRVIEEWTGRPVFLELFVKVKPGWQDDPRFLEELGL